MTRIAPPAASMVTEAGSGTPDVAVIALILSTARMEFVVNTKLLKLAPENKAEPSPLGKLPGGTDEVKTDVPTRVEFSKARNISVEEGLLPVAKLKEILDKSDEKPIYIGPTAGELHPGAAPAPCVRTFPDSVTKFNPVPSTLHTSTAPANDAVSPFTVSVNGLTSVP